MTPLTLTLLFLCSAALCLCSAAAGGFFALWCAHVGRTGAHPLPKIPAVTLFNRRVPAEDEESTNGRPAARRVGP